LNRTLGKGWSIRAYVHHTVDGELMWQLFLRAILGQDGIEIPLAWYFNLEQEEWGRCWSYGQRAVEPTLVLFHASTSSLVDLLRTIAEGAWENSGHITWPGAQEETRISVRAIVLMHIRHLDQHLIDIQAIRGMHGV
jgi:hypothetical protein